MSTRKTSAPHRPRVLITGASSGIGAAFARRLAKDGYDLVLVARRQERLEALAAQMTELFETRSIILPVDLSLESGVCKIESYISEDTALCMLINNAGFGTRGNFVDVDSQKTIDQINLHVLASVRLTRAALPQMVAAGHGQILNISSLAAFFTSSNYTTYSATKSYLNMFTKGLAAELDGTGVQALAVCPGLTRTEFLESPEYADFKFEQVPAWVWMSAEAVVDQSLAALEKNQAVFIPGLFNRIFVNVMNTPLAGRLVGLAIDRLSRRTLY
jgi:uncharacterized protein